MARKRPKTDKEAEALKAKRELFCQYYAKNQETFGNATHSYAEAFGYDLDALPREDVYEDGALVEVSPYDRACAVCATEGGKLLRKPEIQRRITVLLNELLKDEIVDSQLAKLITQDDELPVKVRAINEYNKIRGRIIDKTQQVGSLPFGESDLSAVIATLPQERQDYFYGVIKELIDEAELRRRAGTSEIGFAR